MKLVIMMLMALSSSIASAQYDGGYGPTVAPIPVVKCDQSSGYGDAVSRQSFVFNFLSNKVLDVNSGRVFALTTIKNYHSGFAYTVNFTYGEHWLLEFDLNYWPGNYAQDDIVEVKSSAFPGIRCAAVK